MTNRTVHVFIGGVEEKLVANKSITQFVKVWDTHSVPLLLRCQRVASRLARWRQGWASHMPRGRLRTPSMELQRAQGVAVMLRPPSSPHGGVAWAS